MKTRHAFFAKVFHIVKTENQPEENMRWKTEKERERAGWKN